MNVINIEIDADELAAVRLLDDFALTMLLSEIEDHGWVVARRTLRFIREAGGARQ